MYSSQSRPYSDQYDQRDAVSLWPTVEEARTLDPMRRHEDDDVDPHTMSSSRSPSHTLAFKNHQIVGPSIGRRISRAFSRFVFAVMIGVGCTLAWQSYGNDAKETIRARAPSLAWLLPVSTTSGQKPAAAPVMYPVTSPELVQQLEPMAHNIAVVLFNLEQLTAKQEQLAKNIAALQAVEQDKQSLSSPSALRTPPTPASKPPQPATQATQSSAVRSSSALPAPAPRSPLPLR